MINLIRIGVGARESAARHQGTHRTLSTGGGTSYGSTCRLTREKKGHTHVSTQGGKDHAHTTQDQERMRRATYSSSSATQNVEHVAAQRCDLGGFSKCREGLAPAGEREKQARKVTSPDLPKHEMGSRLVACK